MKNDFKSRVCRLALAVILLLGSTGLAAQQSEIKPVKSQVFIEGKITDDATGEPINAATIKMGKSSAFTNEEGLFKLQVIGELKPTIIVTAPGYDTREVPHRGQAVINFTLSSDQFGKALGSKPKKAELDEFINKEGAAVVTMEEIDLTNPMESVESVLQSKFGTIRSVTHSGMPGVGAAMFLRGINTLNVNAKPLFILDGVMLQNFDDQASVHDGFFSNPLTHIDLREVESITVIKDAVSLYGAKAANGVVMIETRRSKDMVTHITANINGGVRSKPQTIPVMDAEQHRLLVSDILKDHPDYDAARLDKMKFFNDNPTFLYYKQNHNNTAWKDFVYRDAVSQSYSLAATGGDEVGMYAIFVNYRNNQGLVRNTSMQQISTRFNSDIVLRDNISISTKFALSNQSYDLKNDGIISPTSPSGLSYIKAPALYPYSYAKMTGIISTLFEDYDELGVNNPEAILKKSQQINTQNSFIASAYPTWEINKNLVWKATLGYSMNKLFESYFTPEEGVAPYYLTPSISDYVMKDIIVENEARSQTMRSIQTNLDNRLVFTKQFKKHHLQAIGGFRYIGHRMGMDYIKGFNTGEDNLVNISKDLKYRVTDGIDQRTKELSWYLSGSWNYNEKYFAGLAASMDASSRFGYNLKGNALDLFGVSWGLFPSVNASWIASSEDFLAPLKGLDLLKFRLSYGLTGNDDIEDYVTYPYFSSENYLGGGVALVLANLGNPQLKWETTTKANAGVDLSLFNNRFSLSADLFSSNTSDLLVLKQLPSIAGFDYYWSNDGELSNKGYELSANARLLNIGKFRWEVGASLAHYQNELLRLADGDYSTTAYGAEILTAVGQPVGVFYGYKTKGVYGTQAEAEADGLVNRDEVTHLIDYSFGAGDVIFEDFVADGVIDENDKQIIGNPNPDFVGTLSSRIGYKGVNLDILFNYSYGNDVYNFIRRQLESVSDVHNQSTAVLNRWRSENDVTNMPKAVWGDPAGNARFSDRWIEDASYLRLKTLCLSWELPYRIPMVQNLTVWASANNLWTGTKYLGADPETSISSRALYQGIDIGLTPQSPSFYIGVKIGL